MSVPVEAGDLSVGDFLPGTYGSIVRLVEHRNGKTHELISVDLYFTNGTSQTGVSPHAVFNAVQGGGIGTYDSTIRPGLAEDHKDGK